MTLMHSEFTIHPTKIKGKDRPRYRRIGKFVSTYTPKATKNFEEDVANQFIEQCGKISQEYKNCEITVELSVGMAMPKSWSKKKKEQMRGKGNTSTPDLDNIVKAIFDALNGIAYEDDSQITFFSVSKHWEDENYIKGNITYIK